MFNEKKIICLCRTDLFGVQGDANGQDEQTGRRQHVEQRLQGHAKGTGNIPRDAANVQLTPSCPHVFTLLKNHVKNGNNLFLGNVPLWEEKLQSSE